MKKNLLTELICNVLLYSIGFGGLMVVCAVAEGQLSLLPAFAIGAVLCFTFNAVAGVRIALRHTHKAAPHPCALCAVGMPLKFCRHSLVAQRHCNPVRNVLLLY